LKSPKTPITTETNLITEQNQPFTENLPKKRPTYLRKSNQEATNQMATEKQIAANRANAQHSTGPRTEEGKTRSALNGLPKGRLHDAMVIGSESQTTFHALEAEYLATYRPQDAAQRFYLDQMVSASWRMYRLWHVERAAIDQEFQRQITPIGPAEDLT
jgi:hypothetical protein